jgi:hypothetical protein
MRRSIQGDTYRLKQQEPQMVRSGSQCQSKSWEFKQKCGNITHLSDSEETAFRNKLI